MTIQAPAKVNLALRILARREDGYHEIETLMVPVSLADEIEITVVAGQGIKMTCDAPDIPVGPDNLVWRAAETFQRQTGQTFSTTIALRKKIPHGAGLGGGSSNAAAVIKALNQIRKTGLSEKELEEMAATLGSDVPFFIRCHPAICRRRGEQIAPAPIIPPTNLLLLNPPFPISTAWAYQTWKPGKSPPGQPFGSIELVNDLEIPVFKKYLLLPAIKEWLLAQKEVSAALMTGSGSTLFAILRQKGGSLAERAKAHFGTSHWISEVQTRPAFSIKA